MRPFKKITLPNGLRLVLAPRASSVAASIYILVEAGSEYETKKINGLSHFLEHMVFKGTARRPRPGMIAEELTALGAQFNAFTSQELTGYWAKAAAAKFPKILDIVADLYLNPLFAPEEIEKERGVVIEEMNMYEDMPMRRVHDLFLELVHGDQPAGWRVDGEKDVIRRLGREDFIRYREARYAAPATVVVMSGKFDEKSAVKAIRATMGVLPRRAPKKKPPVRAHEARPRIRLSFKESGQSHLVLGFRGWDIFDRRRYALQVLADVLGGGMSSRLWKRVREELGAAYYISADADFSLDHGLFTVAAGADHARTHAVIGAIMEECLRLRNEPVPPAELARSKDHLTGGLILGLETADELGGFYGEQEIMTRNPLPPETIIDRINGVTAAEVRAAARAVLKERGANLAIIGPHRNESAFEKLLQFPKN